MEIFNNIFESAVASNETDYARVVNISLFVAVLCLCIVFGHLLRENRWVNESATAIALGSVTGTIILFIRKGRSSHILRFDEELFFIYLLPPIIFNAGFQVKKKQFFHNFLTILLLGVAGVFISVSIISAGSWLLFPRVGFNGLDIQEYLALGVIFSATDTVCTLQVLNQDDTPRLYSLVFGEGVVNDATSVVLFHSIRKAFVSKINGLTAVRFVGDFLYLFSTSTILGVVAGLLTAYVLKTLYFGRHSTDREIAIMILMAYLSYMLAEEPLRFGVFVCINAQFALLQLSGILTVFICGIFMSHYAWHNVSENSRVTTRHIFATLSLIAETFIFLYVGMDAFDIEKWKMAKTSFKTTLGINCIIIFLVSLGRAAFVFPFSILSNYLSSNVEAAPITFKHQFIIWWAGLMRGAVSIALAFRQFTFSGVTWDPNHATMITSTIVVVLFSTLFFGILTKPLVRTLLPHRAHARGDLMRHSSEENEEINFLLLPTEDLEDPPPTSFMQAKRSLSMLLERPAHIIHAHWRKFDDKYMRPVFGGQARL